MYFLKTKNLLNAYSNRMEKLFISYNCFSNMVAKIKSSRQFAKHFLIDTYHTISFQKHSYLFFFIEVE